MKRERRARYRPPAPLQLEKRYVAALQRRMQVIARAVQIQLENALHPLSEEIDERAKGDRRDSATSDAAALLQVIALIEIATAREFTPDAVLLAGLAEGVEDFASRVVAKQIKGVPGISLVSSSVSAGMITAWTVENAALITSLQSGYFADVAKVVEVGVRGGQTTAQIAEAIEARTSVALSRAELIARDQVGTLNAQVTRAKQVDLGVTRYEWSTSQDERVRPEHAARNRKVFFWNRPPEDGHPGEPIRCRCCALPIFD